MELWNAVCKTDPAHTKPIKGKGYSGTSPRPHWVFQQATRVFGPCGIGWGFETLKDEIVDVGKGQKVHIARVKVWYIYEGQRGEVEHYGGTKLCWESDKGLVVDDDAPKKSITDALIKALSLVGFAGDIFLGQYEDCKYLASVREEFEQAARQERQAAAPTPPPDRKAMLQKLALELDAASRKGTAALSAAWKVHYPNLNDDERTDFLEHILPPLKEKAKHASAG